MVAMVKDFVRMAPASVISAGAGQTAQLKPVRMIVQAKAIAGAEFVIAVQDSGAKIVLKGAAPKTATIAAFV